jgi:hypothetical protein
MFVVEDKVFAVGGIAGLLGESVHPRFMLVMTRRASREDPGFWLNIFKVSSNVVGSWERTSCCLALYSAPGGEHKDMVSLMIRVTVLMRKLHRSVANPITMLEIIANKITIWETVS